MEDLCNPRGQKEREREAAGAGAPAPPPRLTPPGEGGRKPPPRWRITPLYAKREPSWGRRGRQVGRLLVSVSSRVLCCLRGALGSATGARPVLARTCPDHRAASAARSLSSPLGGAGFLVTVGPGAHGTCWRRLGGRPGWGLSHLSPAAAIFLRGRAAFARHTAQDPPAVPRRAETRARGRALCALGCRNVDAVRGKLCPSAPATAAGGGYSLCGRSKRWAILHALIRAPTAAATRSHPAPLVAASYFFAASGARAPLGRATPLLARLRAPAAAAPPLRPPTRPPLAAPLSAAHTPRAPFPSPARLRCRR